MKRKSTKSGALRRYTLLQVPELALAVLVLCWAGDRFGLKPELLITLLLLWVIKDIALFFWVWPAYARHDRTAYDIMAGKVGECIEPLRPAGYIAVDGELWQAELAEPHKYLAKGRHVVVVEGKGLLLKVRPL